MKDRLKRALSQRRKRIVDASLAPSAVLLPIFYKEGKYHILFTKRTETVKYHKGQVSFPGGAYKEEDGTLLNTALRECAEEIGLAPEAVEVLGELDDTLTVTSGFIISPFVAVIQELQPRFDPIEIEEILEIPISALLDKDCLYQTTEVVNGQKMTTYAYHYQENIIWGATAEILSQFLNIFTQGR